MAGSQSSLISQRQPWLRETTVKPALEMLLLGALRASGAARKYETGLPITKGLQESMQTFEELDLDIGLERILNRAVPEPLGDRPYSDETESRLPAIAGGLSLALARTFKIIDPKTKHPATEEWERAFRISTCCYRPTR